MTAAPAQRVVDGWISADSVQTDEVMRPGDRVLLRSVEPAVHDFDAVLQQMREWFPDVEFVVVPHGTRADGVQP